MIEVLAMQISLPLDVFVERDSRGTAAASFTQKERKGRALLTLDRRPVLTLAVHQDQVTSNAMADGASVPRASGGLIVVDLWILLQKINKLLTRH